MTGAARPITAGRWSLWPVALVVMAAWLVLAWPWLSGSVTVPWDAKAHFQPQLQFLANALHGGQSPAWTPNVFGGHPQIADPQSLIFSPPYLLLAALVARPSFAAIDGVAFGALLLGGIAILALFRDRGWHRAGAVVAALGFMFGGVAAWRIQHTGQVLSLAWWPVALLFLDRALARGSTGSGLLAGIFAGFMVLGRDQVAFLGVLLLAGRVLAHIVGMGWRPTGAFALIRPLAAGTVGGALTVAVPLLFTMLLSESSNRSAIDLAGAERGSLHPASLLTFVIPHLYGVARPLIDYWGPPSPDWGPTDLYLARNMATAYFGALPLAAILVTGLVQGAFRAREIRWLVVAAAALLLYVLGRYTPAFAAIFAVVPGVDLWRRPADALFPLCAVLALLAGYAVHRRIAGDLPPVSRIGWLVLFACLVAAFGAGIWLASSVGRLGQAASAIAAAALILVSAVLLLGVVTDLRRRPVVLVLLVAAFMTGDLGWNNGPNESTALPPETYDALRPDTANPTVAVIKRALAERSAPDRRDRVELVGIDFHWPNAGLVHGFDHTLGYNPLRLKLYSDATGAEDHIALPDQRRFSPLFPSYRSPLADLLGLRLIASRVPLEQVDRMLERSPLPLLVRTADAFVYENPAALPRVLFVPASQRADFAAILRDGVWPVTDFRSTVLLDHDVASPGQGTGSVAITSYANTLVEIDVESERGGFVVLNDTWHPWWRVTVDGRPAELLRANVLFRAVRVPAGAHRVRFVFQPLRGALAELRARLRGGG